MTMTFKQPTQVTTQGRFGIQGERAYFISNDKSTLLGKLITGSHDTYNAKCRYTLEKGRLIDIKVSIPVEFNTIHIAYRRDLACIDFYIVDETNEHITEEFFGDHPKFFGKVVILKKISEVRNLLDKYIVKMHQD